MSKKILNIRLKKDLKKCAVLAQASISIRKKQNK